MRKIEIRLSMEHQSFMMYQDQLWGTTCSERGVNISQRKKKNAGEVVYALEPQVDKELAEAPKRDAEMWPF